MGNLAANCKGCDSAKEEENEEIKIVKEIDEPDPIIAQSKISFERKLEKNGKFLNKIEKWRKRCLINWNAR